MHKESKYIYYAAAALAAVLLVAGAFYAYRTFATPMLAFENTEYGISFKYPSSYAVEEHHFADRHSIVLADKEALAQAPQSGEGPTTITFDIFDNPKGLTPSEWVRQNSASNFQLSPNGVLASTTQSGAEAVAYVWDGLYRGESYVFADEDDIVMASVTMLESDDEIRAAFERILRSLVLE